MKENLVQCKSYSFALKVVGLYQRLTSSKREFILVKQLLRSGTSIGANVEEAIGGHSRADFAAKLSIAYKEARETSYWLRLLKDSSYITEDEFIPLHNDAEELCRIINAIRKTTRESPSPS